jgi:hypothetical protein
MSKRAHAQTMMRSVAGKNIGIRNLLHLYSGFLVWDSESRKIQGLLYQRKIESYRSKKR